jgi:hypothetical protein
MGQHLMDAQRDTQRCQNHGPVRLLVPLLEFNQLWNAFHNCSVAPQHPSTLIGEHFKPGAMRPSSEFPSPVRFAFPDTSERRSPGVGY